MKPKVLSFFQASPYRSILLLALVVRLLAAVFARGYGMHDDHFCVIEPAQSWVDGTDYNNWLPQHQEHPSPQGHSFFYVGIHFLLFSFLQMLGCTDPQWKMFIVRLLHGLLSLLTVACGYKIAERVAGQKVAVKAGLLLALCWFAPFFSVRNLVEAAAIPFLFWSTWIIYKTTGRSTRLFHLFVAGLIAGVAFSLRFQTLVFIGGMGIALLIEKKWKETLSLALGTIISIAIIQGLPDLFIWGRPFAEMTEYIRYNLVHRYEYGINRYTLYLEVIGGFLIPPVCFLFFWGYFSQWKKQLLLFLPSFLFLVFHTWFPNKQERFIYTIVPFVVLLGVIGWEDFYERVLAGKAEWNKWNRRIWNFFWIVNTFLLIVLTFTYSKRSRVESMVWLGRHNRSLQAFLIDDVNRRSPVMTPLFYTGQWPVSYQIGNEPLPDSSFRYRLVRDDRYNKVIYSYDFFRQPGVLCPQYVLFADSSHLQQRIAHARKYFPHLQYRETIRPGLVDRLITKINPFNRNEYFFIYEVLPRHEDTNTASAGEKQEGKH